MGVRTAIALTAVIAALALAGCGADPAPPGQARSGSSFRPVTSSPPAHRGRWPTAAPRHAVILRDRPGGRRLAKLGTRTEFGSRRVLGVLRRRGGWLAVLAPELPNGRMGWIPAAAALLGATDLSLHVDVSRRSLELRDGRRVVRRMPVAVGRPGNDTPLGRYAVTDRLHTGRTDSPYGCCAIALTGHQTNLPPGWPGGDRLAIHGTPQAGSIGRAASLGCLRAPTAGLRALMRRVAAGTPVFVRR